VGNTQEMVQSIIGLLSDEDRRIALANKAKEVSKSLNWDNISVEELKQISKLLKH
jgi:glycosyltransferase involved in cell wall biosynthesis